MEAGEDIDAAIAACLLARGSSATLRALADLGPRALTRWIEVFHGRDAVRGLVGRDSDEARAALARARDDPEEMIRREAARTSRSRR